MSILAVAAWNRRPDVAAITSEIDIISDLSWSLSGRKLLDFVSVLKGCCG
jgi:hypothetical protein